MTKRVWKRRHKNIFEFRPYPEGYLVRKFAILDYALEMILTKNVQSIKMSM